MTSIPLLDVRYYIKYYIKVLHNTSVLSEMLITNQVRWEWCVSWEWLIPSLTSLLDAGVHTRLETITGCVPSFLGLEISYVARGKAMAPHSSTLAWKIPRTEESGRLQSMGLLRVEHDWATSLSLSTFMHWRRKWQPTPVFLPGESQGWGSLVGCRL